VTRYRDKVTLGTLANWRAAGVGLPYLKIGKTVLHPVDQLDMWDKKELGDQRRSSQSSLKRHTSLLWVWDFGRALGAMRAALCVQINLQT
jgi:hypothetical protein